MIPTDTLERLASGPVADIRAAILGHDPLHGLEPSDVERAVRAEDEAVEEERRASRALLDPAARTDALARRDAFRRIYYRLTPNHAIRFRRTIHGTEYLTGRGWIVACFPPPDCLRIRLRPSDDLD